MSCEHIYTYINPTRERDLDRAVHILANSGVIAYPTDVNWALGCDARNQKGLSRMRSLKPDHPKVQPFSLICSSISMASSYANITGEAYRVMKKTLPGPYTFLLERSRSLPKHIDDKRRVVGIRIPEAPLLLELVEKAGFPLATTGFPEITDELGQVVAPKFGYQIMQHFGHALDLILDLGDELPGLESTIVDLSADQPRLIREGAGNITALIPIEET